MSREPVGSRKPRNGSRNGSGQASNIWFLVSVAAVAISVAVLLTVAVSAMSGGDDDDSPASPDATATTQTGTNPLPSVTQPAATNTQPAPTTTTTSPAISPTATTRPGETFPRIDCLDLYAPADKKHVMSADCAPGDLIPIPGGERMRREAGEALIAMIDAAAKEGVTLLAVSGYRSYQTQETIYASAVRGFGQEYADRSSAKPGHSEHQLGTAMDVSTPSEGGELEESFGDTPAGRWVAQHAHEYGFVLSYPAGAEAITGYMYEPWHIRYLRKDVALQVHNSGKTLTEYLAGR